MSRQLHPCCVFKGVKMCVCVCVCVWTDDEWTGLGEEVHYVYTNERRAGQSPLIHNAGERSLEVIMRSSTALSSAKHTCSRPAHNRATGRQEEPEAQPPPLPCWGEGRVEGRG